MLIGQLIGSPSFIESGNLYACAQQRGPFAHSLTDLINRTLLLTARSLRNLAVDFAYSALLIAQMCGLHVDFVHKVVCHDNVP